MNVVESGSLVGAERQSGAAVTTVEAAYQALKADIISGKLKPAELLRIDRISRAYGIGPTPLRETLQRLTAEGLVISRGGRGFQVALLDAEEIEDLNIARTAIEQGALRLSIAHGGEDWEGRVVAAGYIIQKWDAQMLKGDADAVDKWEQANKDFHAAILSGCGSRWLLHTRDGLSSKCERYRRAAIAHYGPSYHESIAREHKELLQAVLDRDADRSCDFLVAHYKRTLTEVQRMLSAHDADAAR